MWGILHPHRGAVKNFFEVILVAWRGHLLELFLLFTRLTACKRVGWLLSVSEYHSACA